MAFIITDGLLKQYYHKSGEDAASVVIPSGVSSIGERAFFECKSLESVTIPDSVVSIGKSAFCHCKSLTSIVIPESVTSIEPYTFYDCKSLNTVTLPDGLINIGDVAFSTCESLACITIPSSVKRIGEGAFFACKSLTNVTIPNSVTSIGDRAFLDCSSLTSVTIQNGEISIGEKAFANCDSLTNVNILSIVTSIGECAFSSCRSLMCVTFMNHTCSIKKSVFEECDPRLVVLAPLDRFERKVIAIRGYLIHPEMYTGDIVEGYQAHFVKTYSNFLAYIFENDLVFGLSMLADAGRMTVKNYEETFLVPAQEAGAKECVAFILDWTAKNISQKDKDKEFERQFTKDVYNAEDMKKLWKYEINEKNEVCLLKYKGQDADVSIPERIGKKPVVALTETFKYLSFIKSVTIPNSVTCIGRDAFFYCKSLASITIPDSVKRIETFAFYGCESLTSITIPSSVTSIGIDAFASCSVTIRATEGSYADSYCKEHHINVEYPA